MLTSGFQLKDVSFYLDGVSFVYKLYPKGEIRAYGSREQRKEGEGLRITAKGKKAIAYGKGVMICEQFLGKKNGNSYSKFAHKHFLSNFAKANNSVKSFQIRSFFWSVFSHIRTEYGEILRISPDSVRMQENTDQKKLRIWTLFTQSQQQWRQIIFRNWGPCTKLQRTV